MLKLSHPIISINGFKIGDRVRLKDGDGRAHIIKSFSIDGIKEFFFEVQFEDGTDTMLDNITSLPSVLDEAAEEYAWKKEEPLAEWERLSACFNCFNPRIEAFKAGAEWMAGRDKEKIEQAFFSGYNECEDRMKKEFERRAMAGEVNNTGYPTTIQLHTFDSSLKNGDKVNIIIIKQEQD